MKGKGKEEEIVNSGMLVRRGEDLEGSFHIWPSL